MKKSFIFIVFTFIFLKNSQAQYIDSLHVHYDNISEQLSIFLKGKFHSLDPDGIVGTKNYIFNDTLFFIVDYSVCGTWPMMLIFDTIFMLNKKLVPGNLQFVMYSNYIQNLDSTDCRFSPLPDTIIDTAYFTLNVPLSIQEHSNPVAIYPNPTRDFIYIPEQYLQKKFLITDVLGRKCMEGILSDEKLNLAALKPGQYILVMEGVKPIKLWKE